MRVGFIGLGTLGKAMARRLIGEGVKLTVWNRSRDKARDLGVPVAGSPSELIGGVDILFMSLFDSDAVEAVAGEIGGLLECHDLEGKVIVDMTTNHFAAVARFHAMFGSNGVRYLEAPALGSVVPAMQGLLTVLVSGPREGYDIALPYIEKLGKRVFYLAKPGQATRMKLLNNLMLANFMASIAESLVLGEELGVDTDTLLEIFASGAGNSALLASKREKLLREDYSPHFSSALMYKDLHYLHELARDMKSPLLTGGVKELYALACSRGLGDMDFSAIHKMIKDLRSRL